MNIADALGRLLAPILIPIIKEALRDFFKDSAEVGQPNPDLQQLWDAGVRDANDIHTAGHCGCDDWMDEGGICGGSRCQGGTHSLGGGSSAWHDDTGAADPKAGGEGKIT